MTHSELQPSTIEARAILSDDYGGAALNEPAPEIRACLARAAPVWIFGYGSLMWNPEFPHDVAMPALLRGWHRRFCVYSRRYRGTPERPGLVLGLDRGGACHGMVFRIPVAAAAAALRYLWEREMVGGVYDMREVRLVTREGRLAARAFTVRRHHEGYAGRLSVDETARFILQGCGGRGPCREYLDNTIHHLGQLGLADRALIAVQAKVRELAAAQGV